MIHLGYDIDFAPYDNITSDISVTVYNIREDALTE